MTKIEQISQEAAALSDYQLEAALEFIRGMKQDPFFYAAPPEALASIERGREQLARGEQIELEELSRRLERAASRDNR
jgi:hypothetical protein